MSAIQVKYAFISLGALYKTVEQHKQEPQLPREPPNQESSRTRLKSSTMKLLLFFALIPFALSASLAKDTTTSSPSEETTTTEQESCKSHTCKEDGLFPEGSCEESFCQCTHGVGVLQHCWEGTFFHPEYLVCDFPWDIPGCAASQHL